MSAYLTLRVRAGGELALAIGLPISYDTILPPSQVVSYDMGRKPIGEKAANPFVMRLPDEIAMRVDAYAKCEGIKTRSEAARSLLMLGLATHYEAEKKRTAPKRTKKAKAD